jgi:segregation and condensation protein A
MTYEVKIEKYSGPLDLLLQLIDQQKLEITEVSISDVTDQYLKHLESMENVDPEELADFLVLAGRLLLLKSKALLPYLVTEEEPDDLEAQLKMYKEFIEASKKVEAMLLENNFCFSRTRPPQKTEIEFAPPKGLKTSELKQVFLTVLKRLDPLVKLPKQAIERTVSLQQKIFEIKDFLGKQKNIGFKHLISKSKNRTEVIIHFLAILELLKQEHLQVKQKGSFDDILIEKI